jgi:hypothetical protein
VTDRPAASTKIDGGEAAYRIWILISRPKLAIRNVLQVGVGGPEICARRAIPKIRSTEWLKKRRKLSCAANIQERM